MPDKLSSQHRSWNMSRIKNKDTTIEVKVRKWLFSHGFRFRKNVRKLPGHPDVVLTKYNTVIFIHGCFWHRHENCKGATVPKTRTQFWESKFKKTVSNDAVNIEALQQMGWRVVVLWECQIERKFDETMTALTDMLKARLYKKEVDFEV